MLRIGPYGRKGERIGEASHPGPCRLPVNTTAVMAALSSVVAAQCIVMSLCDGMICAAISLQNCDAAVDVYLGSEINAMKRRIARTATPVGPNFPGINQGWNNDVRLITEADAKALGENNVKNVSLWRTLR